jgi:glycosyltransferase involved in cell wall biosynthesis
MHLQPAKIHEPVTILMVPFDQYSVFPSSVDFLFKETRYPFNLIIVEGNAPDNIRHELERKQDRHKNIKIIYSNHRPRMAQAFNLGLAHIRTPHVFFMHNSLRVTPGWLPNLMEMAKHKTGVICPYVSYAPQEHFQRSFADYPVTFSQNRIKETHEVDMHGFLITKELLAQIGEFDEMVSTPFVGVDLGNKLKAKDIQIHRDPYTVMEYQAPVSFKGADLKLFKHQWDDQHTRKTLAYLNEKWGVSLDEGKYLEWLDKKRSLCQKKPIFVLPAGPQETPIRINIPKLGFKKFLQVLRRA